VISTFIYSFISSFISSFIHPFIRTFIYSAIYRVIGVGSLVIAPTALAFDEARIALIIGNSNYESAPLKNPRNDAQDMARSLKTVGFDVILELDADEKTMVSAIRDFGRKLRDKRGAGLFYFAGHGMQVAGENYLLPIGADILEEDEIAFESISVNRVLEKIDRAGNRVNIIILDACRNNPFERSFRSATRGLAVMQSPSGTLIAFATEPGSVAMDGDGRNGVYTQELLKQMKTPGLDVGRMFRRVRSGVMGATGEKQVPWETSSLIGDFYFVPGKEPPSQVVIQTPKRNPTASPARMTTNSPSVEVAYWHSIEKSNDPAYFQSYLNKYPNGSFADLAMLKLNALTPSGTVSGTTTATLGMTTSALAGLLAAAQTKEQALQLTSPRGDNAFEDYSQALQMDPDNSTAKQGIERIVRTYVGWAERALSDKDYHKADRYLTKAAFVQADDPSVLALQKQLERADRTNIVPVDLGQASAFVSGSALVALPEDGAFGKKTYADSGRKTAQALVSAARKHLSDVKLARQSRTLQQNLAAARHQGAEFLIYAEIQHWEDRATLWSGKKDRVEILVDVIDVRSGDVIISELIDLANTWGLRSKRPEDLLPEAMDKFFTSIQGKFR
jgi:hypothetical protein